MNSFARRPKAWEQRRNPTFAIDAALFTINSHDREGETGIWGRCSDQRDAGIAETLTLEVRTGNGYREVGAACCCTRGRD